MSLKGRLILKIDAAKVLVLLIHVNPPKGGKCKMGCIIPLLGDKGIVIREKKVVLLHTQF